MDLRQYDPAIARWTAIDPVTHWEYSTYSAFDNNPVFFADPSGADAINANGGLTSDSGAIYWGQSDSEQNKTASEDDDDKKKNDSNNLPIGATPLIGENGFINDDPPLTNDNKNSQKKTQYGFATNAEDAKTLEEFMERYKGRSLSSIKNDILGVADYNSLAASGGPSIRYVIDPQNENKIIDMRHFLVVGLLGEDVGLAVELYQLAVGENKSAFDPQDFYSNRLGRKFYEDIANKALKIDDPMGKASYLHHSFNSKFTDQLENFLKNR